MKCIKVGDRVRAVAGGEDVLNAESVRVVGQEGVVVKVSTYRYVPDAMPDALVRFESGEIFWIDFDALEVIV